jgi:phosphatidylethanolamine N-methyltransferase
VSRQGGVSKQLKSVAERNKGILEAAQSHPKVVGVRREWERYQKDASHRIEDFVSKSKPKLEEMVEDTRTLFQQSKDRLLIVRQGDDIATVDRSKYSITLVPSLSSEESGISSSLLYQLGEPINVQWKAPPTHSRRDWIGIYLLSRFGDAREANQEKLVTKISSQGKWVALAEDEWEGDTPLDDSSRGHASATATEGILTFEGDRLPWAPGRYEVRYHHDAKHNVLARSTQLEIYVNRPKDLDSSDEAYRLIGEIVRLALGSSYAYLPRSSTGRPESENVPDGRDSDSDPDDFTIWDVKQAQRIAKAIYYCFDIEFTSEVVVAEANVRKLANDVVQARQVLTNNFRPTFAEQ